MVGNLLKRSVNALVVCLAALTFFLVPIGPKTTFQHFIAIFSSPPAREAGLSFTAAGRRATASVQAELHKLFVKKPAKPAPKQ